MNGRITLALATTLVLAACSNATSEAVPIPGAQAGGGERVEDSVQDDSVQEDSVQVDSVQVDPSVPDVVDTAASTTTTTAVPETDTASTTTTAVDETTTTTPTTSTSSTTTTTTTTTVPELDVFTPECVVEVAPGDSLGLIVDEFDDETIDVATVRAENGIDGDVIDPGQLLDICVDNGLDDITGEERARNTAVVAEETIAAVMAQQEKLNELLTPFGMRELLVDGISGPVTRRHLCAARLGLWLPASLTDMVPGSPEEETLFASVALAAPITTALGSDRWVMVDRTCQVMFAGQGDTTLDFVFPTSTGSDGFETRDQNRSRIFRFDPALDNGGWHNSTTYPVAVDNPLSGNMYKPLYFDGGQAIHGANNVPTTPQSKGCVRLSPSNQDRLIDWAGVAGASGPIGSVGVTVNVQGEYTDVATDAVTPGNATNDA